MKRYNSTPNRLSYTVGKYPPPSNRYTNKHIITLIILAIALVIILFILLYRSCNNNQSHQTTTTHNIETTNKSVNNTKIPRKKILQEKQNTPVDTTTYDSLPPETDLRILTD